MKEPAIFEIIETSLWFLLLEDNVFNLRMILVSYAVFKKPGIISNQE